MDYRNYRTISEEEAISIINNSPSDTIVKYERDGRCQSSIDKVDKESAIALISEANVVDYNEDKYVPNMNLFFGDSNSENLQYTDRYVSLLFLTS